MGGEGEGKVDRVLKDLNQQGYQNDDVEGMLANLARERKGDRGEATWEFTVRW